MRKPKIREDRKSGEIRSTRLLRPKTFPLKKSKKDLRKKRQIKKNKKLRLKLMRLKLKQIRKQMLLNVELNSKN